MKEDSMRFKNKTLLIITDRYPHPTVDPISSIFVKEQVDELSKYFGKVVVIALVPWIPSFLRGAIKKINPKWAKSIGLFDYTYKNIQVHYSKTILIPIFHIKVISWVLNSIILTMWLKFHKIRPSIIHAHFTYPSGLTSAILKRLIDVPLILTIHENRSWLLKEAKSCISQKIWSSCDVIIRVNKKDIPLLRRYNKNVVNIPNGFSPHRIRYINKKEARKRIKIPQNKKVIFTLGWLIERKGFHILIEAISKLKKTDRKNLLVFIGGSGPYKAKLETLIKRHKLESTIKLVGFIPDSDLKYWMNAADIFVLPSLSEGNPTVMFEALGVGLPFIGTTVGGIPEIITSEDYGILVPPGDPNALADAIEKALNKKWSRKKIREYGKRFTWEKIVKKISNIYKNIKEGRINENKTKS